MLSVLSILAPHPNLSARLFMRPRSSSVGSKLRSRAGTIGPRPRRGSEARWDELAVGASPDALRPPRGPASAKSTGMLSPIQFFTLRWMLAVQNGLNSSSSRCSKCRAGQSLTFRTSQSSCAMFKGSRCRTAEVLLSFLLECIQVHACPWRMSLANQNESWFPSCHVCR